MFEETAKTPGIRLDGDWSMAGVALQLPRLLNHLASLSVSRQERRGVAPNRTEIDMSGVAALDACGCQLLTIFLHNLKQRGLTPLVTGISTDFSEKIHALGFDRLFAAQAAAGECA